MKRWACFASMLVMGVVIGCSGNSPDGAAKDYINEQLGFNNDISMKTNALTYTVSDKTDTSATVRVKGAIRCNGELSVVKKDGKWQVAQ